MEKIWIRSFGLFTASLLMFATPAVIRADDSNVKAVIVEVEAPVKSGDTADARAASEKDAFEKALDLVLPTTMDPKKREEEIKQAGQHIKSFRLLEQKQEGDVLKLRYRCEVITPTEAVAAAAPTPTPNSDAFAMKSPSAPGPQAQPVAPSKPEGSFFEITWTPQNQNINPVDVLQYVESTFATKVNSVKLNRGSLVVNFDSKLPPEQTRQQLAEHMGQGSSVKLLDPSLVEPPTTATAEAPANSGPAAQPNAGAVAQPNAAPPSTGAASADEPAFLPGPALQQQPAAPQPEQVAPAQPVAPNAPQAPAPDTPQEFPEEAPAPQMN